MSMNEIRAMREKRVKLWEAAKAFVESRKDVSGTLSAEDSATYDQMEADVIRMGKEIERLERQEALDLEFDRPTARTLTDKPIAPEGKAEKTGRACAVAIMAMDVYSSSAVIAPAASSLILAVTAFRALTFRTSIRASAMCARVMLAS